MKNYYFCLVFIVVLFSCRKEENQLTFPIVLVSTEHRVVSDIRLFTSSGEIKDTLTIKKYLRGFDSSVFTPQKNILIPTDSRDTLIYTTSDTLLFSKSWPESRHRQDKRLQKPKDGYLYFYMTDTIYLVPIGDIIGNTYNYFDSIESNLGVYKTYFREISDRLMGYSHIIKYLGAYLAKGSYDHLEFPVFSYRFTRGVIGFPGIYLSRGASFYNNKFNPKVVDYLISGDTLAIQESVFIYEKSQ